MPWGEVFEGGIAYFIDVMLSFAGMLAAMDESFGYLMQFLKNSGLYENTIVIFSSDVSSASRRGMKVPT